MRRILFTLALLVFSTLAQASRFTTEDGTDILKGAPVSKLIIHAGEPLRKNFETLCVEQKRNYCNRWGHVEKWYYRDVNNENVYWTITVFDGQVINTQWSR